MNARGAWIAACALLIALILLNLAWELVLAPVKPGGSWLVLKVLPLLLPLFGVLRARRYTMQWSTLLIWLYAAEGAARAWTDAGRSAQLAMAELVLALAYFAATVAYLKSTRGAR
jgi:Predicted membrane protein